MVSRINIKMRPSTEGVKVVLSTAEKRPAVMKVCVGVLYLFLAFYARVLSIDCEKVMLRGFFFFTSLFSTDCRKGKMEGSKDVF